MSVLNWRVNSSSVLPPFLILMTHNSAVNLNLMHFQLWTKESHQSSNFETYKCSGENFSNSSCHFWKQKSVFLQILHDSLVSWKITLDFFRSKIRRKNMWKCTFWGLLSAQINLDQNSSNPCHFWNNKSVFLEIFLTNLEYHQT